MKKDKRLTVDKEYLEYINKLPKDEQAYVRQFYQEYYQSNYHNKIEDPIITDPEMKKEATRNFNSNYHYDLFSILERDHKLTDLTPEREKFFREANDDFDCQSIYKQQGYENAVLEIFYQCLRDLDNSVIDRKLTLARFLNKFLIVRRMHNKEKKEGLK